MQQIRDLRIYRWIYLTLVVSGTPMGVFLYARYDQFSLALFLVPLLTFLLSVYSIGRLAIRVVNKKIPPFELAVFVLIFVLLIAYTSTGHPFWVGRKLKFNSMEKQFAVFVTDVRINSVGSSEQLILPMTLSRSGIIAIGKRYADGMIRVDLTTGGAGGYVFVSGRSAEAQKELDDQLPDRRKLNEHWDAFGR